MEEERLSLTYTNKEKILTSQPGIFTVHCQYMEGSVMPHTVLYHRTLYGGDTLHITVGRTSDKNTLFVEHF